MKLSLNYLIFITIAVLIFVNVGNSYGINDGNRYAPQSILNTSTGKWVKLKVEQNAIYKLTYEDIQALGIDPAKAKIYGYGGWILDEDFRKPYIDDLPEVACWISGDTGTLTPNGYLLFYGRGSVKWSYTNNEYVHENNPYSTYGTYFLTDATPGNPKRMDTEEFPETATTTLTTFEDYMVHEKDLFSLIRSGRELYGENFSGADNNSQTFQFTIPGIVNEPGSISISFISNISISTKLSLSAYDNSSSQFSTCMETTIDPTTNSSIKAVLVEKKANWETPKNENTIIKIDHPCGSSLAYLNYIRLNMLRELKYYNTGYTFFRHSDNLTKSIKYDIENANSKLLVFDITNNYDAKLVKTTFDENTNTLSFYSGAGVLREFALIDPLNNFDSPQKLNDVEPQNLHGLGQIDMAIISPKAFVSEAERLAQKHREDSGLNVAVVTSEQVYNEFSSGTPDASAYRRFMKMFFDRAITNNSLKPKYLLLLGDGIFDNRLLDPTCKSFNKENLLLTYQVKESLKTDESYLCDDYFGFLDESEEGNKYTSKKLMLGIGRFPVQNLTSAKSTVDKTINYMENKNYGIWKNSVVMMADDSDDTQYNQSFTLHMKQADSVAYYVMQKQHPEFMVTKIYFDAFKPEMSGGIKSFTNSAKKKFEKALNDGCLVFNYTGHGGAAGLADGILNTTDIRNMNFKNLPLWVVASCEFSEVDGVSSSGGEDILLSESAGIAVVAASRVVYAQDNVKINYIFMQNLFTKKSNSWPALGDVIKDTKNNFTNNNSKMSYLLIGDPALKLNYPELQIEVDKIEANGISLTGNPLTMKALDGIKVSGFIKGEDNNINTNFNGKLSANVFDGLQTIQTLTTGYDSKGNTYHSYFTDYPGLIAPTHCDVVNGRFEFSFSVMADIANTQNLGKMNLYAYDINSGKESNGYFMNYNVFGINENANIHDLSSPEINKIYLNNESFKPGDTVNETPLFVAEVTDKLGINMAGAGMGHDIQIIIDKSATRTYNLNNYYQPSQSAENTGTISYSIPTLPEGEHEIEFRVWNILNNLTTSTFKFVVEKNIQPKAYEVTANSNPAKIGVGTSFEFTHNKPETRVKILLSVFDLSGRLVWCYKESGASELISAYGIPWNLKSNEGIDVQPGVYVYNVSVTNEEGTETSTTKKMIVVK
ncbi:MAG: type IX secretion system sortase PorU [Candidatus Azobacteroides sp.]|nr:type IX secretion system sortase PorU [Candidatus Azobacteroides sp.]